MSVILIDGGTITVVPDHVTAMTVHDAADCAGRTCVIHAPTDHAMRTWPLQWRPDRGIFERRCEHGVGHPDPDQRAYWRELAERGEVVDEVETDDGWDALARDPDKHADAMMVHGCCVERCCIGDAL